MEGEPTPIGRAVDEAMIGILGEAGFDSYKVLCDQTLAARERIVEEGGAAYVPTMHSEMALLVREFPTLSPMLLAVKARQRVEARIREEVARRISDEEQRFRQATQALFVWTKGKKQSGSENRD